MGRIIIGFIVGLLIGGVLIFYLFVGAPKSVKAPGVPIKPPDASGLPPGTATVVLNQQFFDTVLQTIFRDMNEPSFPLGLSQINAPVDSKAVSFGLQSNCDSRITLKPEGSGATTSVRFENGRILAPLAFAGKASLPFVGCTDFSGWAQGNLELRFEEQQQTVYGQINVEAVNLDGFAPVATGLVTPLVQSTLNSRVNPIEILRGQQLSFALPIAAANGNLQARVRDVRSEIKDNALYLYINYNFSGTRGAGATAPAQ